MSPLIKVSFLCAVICFARTESRVAVAHLRTENIDGIIYFTEVEGGVAVTGRITGLPPGRYGFHIHALGDTSTCDAAGSHFNPDNTNHGGPDHEERHVGDLGNIEFTYIEPRSKIIDDEDAQIKTEEIRDRNAESSRQDVAVAVVDFVDGVIALRGRNNVLGRTLVLHGAEDDLGQGGHENSLTTGNAGSRVACAVIGVSDPVGAWED